MGEFSAARQALEGASVAPVTLTDPEKRPPIPRDELSRVVAELQPAEQFERDSVEFLFCLLRARRGAAAGPSGMTSDHLVPVLESEAASDLLTQVVSLLAVVQVPHTVLEAIRLGRLTALQKPDGGVREIVVGDIIRRLVARTISKQISEKVEVATAPFQNALKTKAGCECVAHVLQTLTDLDPEATIMSIDGVGAYDLISHNATLEGRLRMEGGDQILPFVRCFYDSPSTYLWDDEMGVAQSMPPRTEENKAIPSCPCCSPSDNTERWKPQKRGWVLASVCSRIWTTFTRRPALREWMVHMLSRRPSGMEVLTWSAALLPGAVVWRGDPLLPPVQQGLKVLGVPTAHEAFFQYFLENKSTEQQVLFQRVPWVNDPQADYLLFLVCAETWTWPSSTTSTNDFWRSSQMGSLCGKAHSSP